MSRNFTSRVTQKAAGSRRPHRADVAHVPQSSVQESWFDLQLHHEGHAVEQVEAGQAYTLVLTSSLTRNPAFPGYGIKVLTSILLHIRCEIETIHGRRSIFAKEQVLSAAQAIGSRREFSITIPAGMPSSKLYLHLSYKLPEKDRLPLGEVPLPLKGEGELPDQPLFTDCQIPLELSASAAILEIKPHPNLKQEASFVIRGWNTMRGLRELTCENIQITSIPRLAKLKDISAGRILGKIRHFSLGILPQEVRSWLLQLREVYKDDLCIIIIDSSATEIPWELIEIAEEDDEASYHLGGLARIVHWLPRSAAPNMMLDIRKHTHSGPVIYYLDEHLGESNIRAEQEILKKLAPEAYATLQELERRMRDLPNNPAGMIYVGCHGLAGSSLGQQHPGKLNADQLNLARYVKQHRPIAFFNACESARVLIEDVQGNGSFVATLLKRLASGYIGTIAAVESDLASRIAQRLLELAYNGVDLPIVEILRQLRREAVQEYRDSYLSPEDQRRQDSEMRMISTFVYVYYGNPFATLNLARANEPSSHGVEYVKYTERAEAKVDTVAQPGEPGGAEPPAVKPFESKESSLHCAKEQP